MKHKIMFAFLMIFFQNAFSQSFPISNDSTIFYRNYDIDSVKLNVEINPYLKKISGVSEIVFHPIKQCDSMVIHAVDMTVNSVQINGVESRYKHIKDKGLIVYTTNLKAHNKLEIDYTAFPKKGMYFVAWDLENCGRTKQVWTQGQGIDNRHWFPMYDLQDEKAIYELKINFPKGYNVLSNGRLIAKSDQSTSTTWHYLMDKPMSSYLVTIAGGDYDFIEEKHPSNNIPLQYWYYRGYESFVDATYKYTKEIMSYLEDEIGVKYPWNKYSQIPISDFMFGAMENTGATSFSEDYFCSDTSFADLNYIAVNAHEMAHQWFGNSVTCQNSKHHWLNEGFATFYEWKARRKFISYDDYLWNKHDEIAELYQGTPKKVLSHNANNVHYYTKGGFILELLENKIGPENFKNLVQEYVNKYEFSNVVSKDLIELAKKYSNDDIETFLMQYLDSKEEANLDIRLEKINNKNAIVYKQGDKIFEYDLEIYLHRGKKHQLLNLHINKDSDTVYVDRKIDFIEVDPHMKSLLRFNIPQDRTSLILQLRYGLSSISKYRAITLLENLSDDEINQIRRFYKVLENHHRVNFQLNSAIASSNSKHAQKLRNEIASTSDIELNKYLLSSDNPESMKIENLKRSLEAKSYMLREIALNKLFEVDSLNSSIYLKYVENSGDGLNTGLDLMRIKIELLSKKEIDQKGIDLLQKLIDYGSDCYNLETRLNAVYLCVNIGFVNDFVVANILNIATSFNSRYSGSAKELLEYLVQFDDVKDILSQFNEIENIRADVKELLVKLLNSK